MISKEEFRKEVDSVAKATDKSQEELALSIRKRTSDGMYQSTSRTGAG